MGWIASYERRLLSELVQEIAQDVVIHYAGVRKRLSLGVHSVARPPGPWDSIGALPNGQRARRLVCSSSSLYQNVTNDIAAFAHSILAASIAIA